MSANVKVINGKKIDLEQYKTLTQIFHVPHSDAMEMAEVKDPVKEEAVKQLTYTRSFT